MTELRELETETHALAERRAMAAEARRRIDIRAPQAGTVVGLGVFTVGGVVAPGQPILHIIPANDERVIDAEVRPEDIDKVAMGQAAAVRFPAFDRRTTPELTGMVTMVSADR